jgi:hypothetical protein
MVEAVIKNPIAKATTGIPRAPGTKPGVIQGRPCAAVQNIADRIANGRKLLVA